MKPSILIFAIFAVSCTATTQRKIDRTLDLSCPIVEAYGPIVLAELTKQPAEKFEALAKVCEAARAVSDSLSIAGAPSLRAE